jgi:hypothetical protein
MYNDNLWNVDDGHQDTQEEDGNMENWFERNNHRHHRLCMYGR